VTSLPPEEGVPELGPAFRLPAYIMDKPELVRIFEESVRKLQAESRGMPMHTVQEFLLERIATKYVLLKYREMYGAEANGHYIGVNAEKDANTHWLDLVKEWDKVLASGQEQMREAFITEFTSIALRGVELVEDKNTRQMLTRHFKEQFAAAGY